MILEKNCKHNSAMMRNCKYCPDCGKKIIHKWVTIKCRVCGHYRKPAFALLGKIKPVKKYCFNCGSEKWDYQYYYESTIPDRMKTISLKQIQTVEEFNNRFKTQEENTKVWVDTP